MTPDACREWRGTLASQALGRIEPAEEIALRAHLDGCADCRAELRELSTVARALPEIDAARAGAVDVAPEPPGRLAAQVLQRLARERERARHRHRGRVLAVAGAAIAAAAVIAAVLVFTGGGGPTGTRVVFPATNGARGDATLLVRPAGTEVHLHFAGLHRDGYYWLWLTGDDGDRVAAGTFRGDPDAATVRLTAALPLGEARRIWVTDDHDRVVLDARLSSRE